MWKTKDIGRRNAKEAGLAYGYLLSGDPERIATARDVIAAYRQAEPEWRALDVIDMVKRWINQDRGDRDAKNLALLEKIRNDSWDPGDELSGAEKWKYKGRMARALFYCGRFRKAHKRFGKAKNRIGDPEDWPDDKQDAYDILTAQAEALVYLGFPDTAKTNIEDFPRAERIGWRGWVLAFALHQLSFKGRVGFGRAKGPGDTMPGQAALYRQSNDLLDSIQGDLEPIERHDSHLLKAANFGALSRLGFNGAMQQAKDAFDVFKAAPPPSTNATWSGMKESRGRFPIAKFDFDPGNTPAPATRTWRTAYFGHYLANLKVCGLPDIALDDGDTDGTDEHGDDTGE